MNIFTCFIAAVTKETQISDTWFTVKYIIVATVFLFLLWGLSKYLTSKQSVKLNERNIKVVERIAISNDKFFYLIELDKVYYLVGSHKGGFTVIDKREHLNIENSKKIEAQPGAFFEQLKASILKKEIENNSKDTQDE